MIRLHVGCGNVHLPGFVNVDCRETPAVDLVMDCGTLPGWKDGSVDLIYACHVLDQFSRHAYMDVLRLWCGKLKSGGVLRLSCVDFDAVVSRYASTSDLTELIGLLHARQDYPTNVRKMSWNRDTLTADMEAAGLTDVRPWNWQNVSHGDVDDCSQAFLPHKCKSNGQLMSLNLEGTKP